MKVSKANLITYTIMIGLSALYINFSFKSYTELTKPITAPQQTNSNSSHSSDVVIAKVKPLPNINIDVSDLEVGKTKGLIGRTNAMEQLFITREQCKEVIKQQLDKEDITDEEIEGVMKSLSSKTNKSYNQDLKSIKSAVSTYKAEQLQKESKPDIPATSDLDPLDVGTDEVTTLDKFRE